MKTFVGLYCQYKPCCNLMPHCTNDSRLYQLWGVIPRCRIFPNLLMPSFYISNLFVIDYMAEHPTTTAAEFKVIFQALDAETKRVQQQCVENFEKAPAGYLETGLSGPLLLLQLWLDSHRSSRVSSHWLRWCSGRLWSRVGISPWPFRRFS